MAPSEDREREEWTVDANQRGGYLGYGGNVELI